MASPRRPEPQLDPVALRDPDYYSRLAHLLVVAIALLVGCSDPAPRYGEATVSAASPKATLTGTTWGQAAALELAPGCPGYLDPTMPAHVVHVSEPLELRIRARSEAGPLALAVAQGDEVRCDSDEGAGHAPELTFSKEGDYLVYVAALREPEALRYTLEVTAGAAAAKPASLEDISVTITSDPSGAAVLDAEGQRVGTTPAMFVVPAPEDGASIERTWTLELEGHEPTAVRGELAAGALVLHGQLPLAGPTEIERSASGPQPILDYQVARLAVDVSEECAITEAEVEVDIEHAFIGDLRVVLHTPWDEELILRRHRGGGRRDLRETWSLGDGLAALAGHSTAGRWELAVHDDAGADEGSFERFDLRLSCGTEPEVVAEAEPAHEERPPRRPTRPARPRLPELPTHASIVSVLSRLRPTIAQRCSPAQGTVRVYFGLQGNGRVQRITTSGSAPEVAQRCVARVVRGARFPRFRRSGFDVDYTFDLDGAPRRVPPNQGVLNPWR